MPPDYVIDTVTRTVGNGTYGPIALNRLNVSADVLYYAGRIAPGGNSYQQETWILASQGWSVTRFRNDGNGPTPAFDWKLEPDWAEKHDRHWQIRDGYLDLVLFEGTRYYLEDADEFADALTDGRLTLNEGTNVLRSLNELCLALTRHDYSAASLLEEYAPGLPS
ncbi:MAG: hypothetical protein WBW04_16660 [Nitrolancea sp.]